MKGKTMSCARSVVRARYSSGYHDGDLRDDQS